MVGHVKNCVKDVKRVYPDYDEDQSYDRYSDWLAMLI